VIITYVQLDEKDVRKVQVNINLI